jgi:hypothetical protein
MTYKKFLLKVLYDNDTLDGAQLVSLYYETCPDRIESKRIKYISEGKEKTEKELKNQVRAELQSSYFRIGIWIDKVWFKYVEVLKKDKKLNSYFLTDIGKKYYEENYLDIVIDEDVDVFVDDIEVDDVDVEDVGIIYLLKSKTFDKTYKIGLTTNFDKRLPSLKKDIRYGVFNLTPIMTISCKDISIIEKMLHKFFEDYRLCRKNDLGVDTELFQNIDTIEEEFELFANMLKNSPRFKSVELKHFSDKCI